MSSSFAAKSRALTARTVHLKLFPAPRNFTEQREVLRVLERFGEVTMFRFLKHRIISPVPNAFIATFASETSVADIINAGPIRYRLVPEYPPAPPVAEPPKEVVRGATDAAAPEMAQFKPLLDASSSSSNSEAQGEAQEAKSEEEPSMFELTISPSILSHAKYITSPHTSPLYGPYAAYPTHKSLVGSMLQKSVTSSMWAPGLRDWETDVERWRLGVADERDVLGGMEEEGGEEWGRERTRRVGKWGVGVGGEEGEGGLSSERAVYTRAVKRRRDGIPKIMWGIRKFKEGVANERENVLD